MTTTAADTAHRATTAPQPANPDPARPAEVIGYRAQDPDGTGNTYLYGVNCRDCDPTYDPYNRTGVPCRDAWAHAYATVQNWRMCGHTASIVPVRAAAATAETAGDQA